MSINEHSHETGERFNNYLTLFYNQRVAKKRRLQVECGTTQISLENAYLLFTQYGKPMRVTLIAAMEERQADYAVLVEWSGFKHMFSGFSWGYGGEGPRGLRTLLETCYWPYPLLVDVCFIEVKPGQSLVVFEKN